MPTKTQRGSKKSKPQVSKSRGSFISKLLQIMKTYPKVLNWTQDGSKLKISDINRMEQEIIPSFYRHSNINSFVRQLNMYYFSKIEIEDENQMMFQNQDFRRGNEDNFHLIQRRNKGRDEIINTIHDKFQPALKTIQNHQYLSKEAKDMIRASIEYQQIATKNLEKIKNNIGTLAHFMKNSRGQTIKKSLDNLRSEHTKKLNQLIQNGKEIDEFLKRKLCVEFQNSDVENKVYEQNQNQQNQKRQSILFNQSSLRFLSIASSFSLQKLNDVSLGKDLEQVSDSQKPSFVQDAENNEKGQSEQPIQSQFEQQSSLERASQ